MLVVKDITALVTSVVAGPEIVEMEALEVAPGTLYVIVVEKNI